MQEIPVAPTQSREFSLVPGVELGRYRLIEPIGSGGMGQVWRAHDGNLDRDVAIKLLRDTVDSPTARERFRREALVLSRLSHPGVATIFDFGSMGNSDFLVMEYVPGGTLEARIANGPLPVEDVVRFGTSIAEALDSAHRSGFLHRDLKPGNVVITQHGHPKILDFGIALLLGGSVDGRLTKAGMAVGSIPYMAPEQLFGQADDVRADIYSFGVMLFEMATGKRPFIKDRPEALMFAIINNAAPSARSMRPELPVALERLIDDCLQKDPVNRPASAAVVSSILRGLADNSGRTAEAPMTRPVVRAIAVLPFRNVSNDTTQEYFAEGMTEAIISELSRIRELRVISRTSAMKYRGTVMSLPEIARELNVNAILEGSVLLVGDRVRVTVRLVSARDEELLWSDRYDRSLEDVLGLHAELAETAAKEIEIQLTPVELRNLSGRKTVNPEAHVEYLKSRHSSITGSREGVDLAVQHAKRALEIDPEFALAWTALADCYSIRAIRGMAPPAQASADAMAAAARALELDPLSADAHASLGIIQVHNWEVDKGLASLLKAIELNPGNAMAHNVLSRTYSALERPAESLIEAQKAVSVDPLSVFIHTGLGDSYYFARDYEKSVRFYRMSLELDARFDGAHTDLARGLEALGQFDEARAAYDTGRRLAGGSASATFGLAHIEVAAGNEKEARRILDELKDARATRVVSAWGIAAVHASLGDVDDAYKWFDIAVTEKSSGLFLFRAHPRLDPIRKDPRYWPLVRKLGLD